LQPSHPTCQREVLARLPGIDNRVVRRRGFDIDSSGGYLIV
jgi:hypothetical protein